MSAEPGKWKRLKTAWDWIGEKVSGKWKKAKQGILDAHQGVQDKGGYAHFAGVGAKKLLGGIRDLSAAARDGAYDLATKIDNTIDGSMAPSFWGGAAKLGASLLRGLGNLAHFNKNAMQKIKSSLGDHKLMIVGLSPGIIMNMFTNLEGNEIALVLDGKNAIVLQPQPKLTEKRTCKASFEVGFLKEKDVPTEKLTFNYRPEKLKMTAIKGGNITIKNVFSRAYDDVEGCVIHITMSDDRTLLWAFPKFGVYVHPMKEENGVILRLAKYNKNQRDAFFTDHHGNLFDSSGTKVKGSTREYIPVTSTTVVPENSWDVLGKKGSAGPIVMENGSTVEPF